MIQWHRRGLHEPRDRRQLTVAVGTVSLRTAVRMEGTGEW